MAAEHISSAVARSRVRLLPANRPSRTLSPPETTGTVFEQIARPIPGGVTWLWARKDLDLTTEEAARRELDTLLEPLCSPGSVLIHLGCEYFVDVRGLRLLTETASWVRSRGCALGVVAPPPCLQRMVQLSRLEAELPLVGTARHASWWARSQRTGTR